MESTPEQRGIYEDLFLRYLACLREHPHLAAIYGPPHGPDFGIDFEESRLIETRLAMDFNRSHPGEPRV